MSNVSSRRTYETMQNHMEKIKAFLCESHNKNEYSDRFYNISSDITENARFSLVHVVLFMESFRTQ